MKKAYIILIGFLFLDLLFCVPMSHAAERDPALEQRLSSTLGVGLAPRDRDALRTILSELDDQTPVATYARARAYEALALAIHDHLIEDALEIIDTTLGHDDITNHPIARAELVNAKGEIYIHAQMREALGQLLPELMEPGIDDARVYYHRLHLIGRSYEFIHDYEQALTYLLRAHEVVMTIEDEHLQRRRQFLNLHVARTHARLRHFDRARQTLDNTIEESYRYGLEGRLPELYMVRGFVIQVTEGPNEAAEADFLKATQAPEGEPVGRTQMLAFNNLGALNLHNGNYEAAERYFEKGVAIAQAISNTYELHIMLFNQGYVMVKQGEFEPGLAIMETAFEDFSQTAPPSSQADMLNYLADAYQTAGNMERELEVVRQQLALREASYRAERERVVGELQVRYDAQEAALRIQWLEQESALREARLAEQQRNQRWIGLLSIFLFVALAFALLAMRRVRKLNTQLYLANKELTELSNRDPLTQLYNRRALFNFPEQRGDLIILFDLDNFKSINDQFGHDIGDQVLLSVSQRLTAALRAEDLVVRWGGEEFLIVIRRVNDVGIDVIKNKIRDAIIHTPFPNIEVNASGGAVYMAGRTDTWQDAIQRADDLLYQAKQGGRGQIRADIEGELQTWPMK